MKVRVVRPVRIELTTLGLGVPCSIQFELRARTWFALFYKVLRHITDPAQKRFAPILPPWPNHPPSFPSRRAAGLGSAYGVSDRRDRSLLRAVDEVATDAQGR